MAETGVNLLGRKPSPPDLRDYRSSNFLYLGMGHVGTASPESLAAYATSELKQTTITYKQWAARKYTDVTVTHWWKAFNALAQIVTPVPVEPQDNVTWEADHFQLDQGQTGHCVGFGWAAWGDSTPVVDDFDNQDGHDIYYEAKVIEGNPGGEDGAYTRDGAKAMQQRQRLTTYVFASTTAEILDWLRLRGPLVIGTDWTWDMFEPDANGFVKPTGGNAGGHCYLLYGIQDDDLEFKNSWGDSWGLDGSFKMKIADFDTLMKSWGEAIASVELPL